jgi:hypothetical protein
VLSVIERALRRLAGGRRERRGEGEEERVEDARRVLYIKLRDGRTVMATRIIDSSGDYLVIEDVYGRVKSIPKQELASESSQSRNIIAVHV